MQSQKVKYLKNNNGSWTYRRRVPNRHHKTLGIKMWNEPCGDVDYAEAVVMVTALAKKHDALLKQLEEPETANKVRLATEAMAMVPKVDFLTNAYADNGLPDAFDPLEAAKAGLEAADSNPTFDDNDRLVRYLAILETSFGKHIPVSAVDLK